MILKELDVDRVKREICSLASEKLRNDYCANLIPLCKTLDDTPIGVRVCILLSLLGRYDGEYLETRDMFRMTFNVQGNISPCEFLNLEVIISRNYLVDDVVSLNELKQMRKDIADTVASAIGATRISRYEGDKDV